GVRSSSWRRNLSWSRCRCGSRSGRHCSGAIDADGIDIFRRYIRCGMRGPGRFTDLLQVVVDDVHVGRQLPAMSPLIDAHILLQIFDDLRLSGILRIDHGQRAEESWFTKNATFIEIRGFDELGKSLFFL